MARAPLALIVASLAVGGCGADGAPPGAPPAVHRAPVRTPHWPRRAHCSRSAAAVNCAAARGTILYVERVDPDGDGDAHFVLASSESVTGPGITAIDVEKGMRPHPLPRVGDRVTAAGPVYRGSHGQRQIQATELHVGRMR